MNESINQSINRGTYRFDICRNYDMNSRVVPVKAGMMELAMAIVMLLYCYISCLIVRSAALLIVACDRRPRFLLRRR